MSDEEHMAKLKDVAMHSPFTSVKQKTIDALAAYGEKAIPSIAEIADKADFTDIKEHAVDTIKGIKESSRHQ